MSNPARVQAGVPTGGQFSATAHGESDVGLGAGPAGVVNEPMQIGEGLERITVAQARRELAVGARVQAVWLRGQHDNEDAPPRVRTVRSQTAAEMITDGDDVPRGSHLRWAKQQVERDSSGNLIVSDESGSPYVAYIPLADGQSGIDNLDVQVQAADDIVEAKACADPARLWELAGSQAAAARMAVARNRATDKETLMALCRDFDPEARHLVVKHPNTPSWALDQMTSDESIDGRLCVAQHPLTSMSSLHRMSDDPNVGVRNLVAAHPDTAASTLRRLAENPHGSGSRINHSLGGNPNTPPDVLERLSRADGFTMAAVARNPSTPVHTIEALFADASTGNQTRAMAASNPSAPAHVLTAAVMDTDPWVRQYAAKNPNLGSFAAQVLAGDDDVGVRRAVASNPRTGLGR